MPRKRKISSPLVAVCGMSSRGSRVPYVVSNGSHALNHAALVGVNVGLKPRPRHSDDDCAVQVNRALHKY